MKPFIKVDENISLHLPRPEFSKEVFEIIDNQRLYLGKWLPWVEKTKSFEDVMVFIKDAVKLNQNGQKLTTFLLHQDNVIGTLSLVRIDKEVRTAELGYWLRQDFQGQGIITRACNRFIDHIFRTKAIINRIEIRVVVANQKSIKIPKRLGFSHEGTLRQATFFHNQFFDIELFSLLKSDWYRIKQCITKN